MYVKYLADEIILFFENYLCHTKGKWVGQKFIPLEWQAEEVLKPLFGNIREKGEFIKKSSKHPELNGKIIVNANIQKKECYYKNIFRPDAIILSKKEAAVLPTRQYKKVYIEIPKKNGKSELAAGIAIKLLFADKEPGAEIYCAAGDRDQASIVFNVAKEMIKRNKFLSKKCKIINSTKRVVHNNGSYYHAISKEVSSKHGYNVHGMIIDELHIIPRNFFETLTFGSGDARRQPLFFFITTAGDNRTSVCWDEHEYARKIINGTIKDPNYLPLIYAAEIEDDWKAKKTWKKANPSIGKILDINVIKDACKEAIRKPSQENSFKRLRLNMWVRSESRFIYLNAWDKCKKNVKLEDFKGKPCYAGLDLASSTDIAAFSLVFPEELKKKLYKYTFFNFYWCPEATIFERSEKEDINYELWNRQGHITATEGNVIDYEKIFKDITEINESYQIVELGFDRWGSIFITQKLESEGITVVPFGQGYKSMSPPSKELEVLILSKRLVHDGNPVTRFMADNVIVETDAYENIKPSKKKSKEKIDGIVALLIGLGRATVHDSNKSVYEERGMIVI